MSGGGKDWRELALMSLCDRMCIDPDKWSWESALDKMATLAEERDLARTQAERLTAEQTHLHLELVKVTDTEVGMPDVAMVHRLAKQRDEARVGVAHGQQLLTNASTALEQMMEVGDAMAVRLNRADGLPAKWEHRACSMGIADRSTAFADCAKELRDALADKEEPA